MLVAMGQRAGQRRFCSPPRRSSIYGQAGREVMMRCVGCATVDVGLRPRLGAQVRAAAAKGLPLSQGAWGGQGGPPCSPRQPLGPPPQGRMPGAPPPAPLPADSTLANSWNALRSLRRPPLSRRLLLPLRPDTSTPVLPSGEGPSGLAMAAPPSGVAGSGVPGSELAYSAQREQGHWWSASVPGWVPAW